jgi:GR25 family glycosyltransferase involved in LPS biosynthesis
MKKGVFINLDRCSDRSHSLLSQLDSVGLQADKYFRFSAIEPVGDEAQLSKGLKSVGELGIFRSLVSVLAQVGDGGFDDVVHVLEDDTSFSAGIAEAISSLSELMLQHPRLSSTDIVFLDYFLDRDLFAHVAAKRASVAGGSLKLIPAKRAYLAGCGSFLVRKSSASYLSMTLAKILNNADTLAPVDLTLRTLFRIGALSGFLAVPLLCAPSWEQDCDSSIQTHASNSMRKSQRSHILLRLLASGLKSPFWCAQRLEEMYQVPSPLAPDDDVNAFLSYFDSLRGAMPAF